ncbi:MAG: phosphoglucosamine mutase [Deltaproteobacteria bacterium]|nr:phosphoglucosamine mutase [Deltaproteobacteria bacterium]
MRRLFGTDGVRGVANVFPMTGEIAMQLGRGVAHVLKGRNRRNKIVVGKDTRLSGYMLEHAIASGICSMGVDVLLVGPIPTPGIAFLTASMRADAGIMISASHNPFQDNGIKVFSRDGFKLPDSVELQIEDHIFSNEIDSLRPTATEVGKAFRIDDALGRYIVYLKNGFPMDLTLEGIKMVIDCAHGATYKVAPAVFEELGAEIVLMGASPNGHNINDGCGSQHPDALIDRVKKEKADLGVAFDGDGDRAVMVDENGELVDGDHVLSILARDMVNKETLRHQTVVGTLMSNLGLEIALKRMGVRLVRSEVGDRYVVEEMRRRNYSLGGEQSGHIVYLDHSTTGDGILTALLVLAVMMREEKSLAALDDAMESYPQVLVNVAVTEKPDLMTIPDIKETYDEIERRLKDRGRILLRYSGTSSKARVMIEGDDLALIETLAQEMAGVVRKQLG